jgi:hypothetical protein
MARLIRSRGHSEKEINMMMSDETRERYFSEEKATGSGPGNKALESAGLAGATGMTAGELLASAADIGTSIAIPGLGIFIAGPMERRIMNAQRRAIYQMAMPDLRESPRDLPCNLMTQSTELVKGEVALAKAELRDKARLHNSAAMIIAVRRAAGLLAAMALLAAGIIALATYTSLTPSALIFGAALGAPAMLLFKRGLRNFKRHSS